MNGLPEYSGSVNQVRKIVHNAMLEEMDYIPAGIQKRETIMCVDQHIYAAARLGRVLDEIDKLLRHANATEGPPA